MGTRKLVSYPYPIITVTGTSATSLPLGLRCQLIVIPSDCHSQFSASPALYSTRMYEFIIHIYTVLSALVL